MLAVVEDQVPQVLLFQFSIGDAEKEFGKAYESISEKRFQFSIGDAGSTRPATWPIPR